MDPIPHVPAPILIVDDDSKVLEIVCRVLARAERDTVTAGSAEEALEIIERRAVSLVVTDLSMPGMSGLELLERLQAMGDAPPAIVMSGEGTIDRAVRAVQLGALDFLTKPLAHERLVLTVENALRFSRLAAVHEHLKADVEATSKLAGQSSAMARLRALIAKVAPSQGRVLILGENGTGKELVAAAIHAGSDRAGEPFVKLNCAAVPANLVESELFGHEKGAFTGAVSNRRGRFDLADGGTLFLDEIGDMSPAMQAKLLRVLQEGTFERVGGARTIHVDVRVIAATNRNIDAMVREGSFREDLLYRLNVVTLHVPPLRERADDIPALVHHFLRTAGPRNGQRGLVFTSGAMEALHSYPYPGNVRELSNVVERIAILAESETVERRDIEALLPRRGRAAAVEPAHDHREGVSLRDQLREAERRILGATIAAHDGKKAEAARALSVERSHFYKKCRQLGIE